MTVTTITIQGPCRDHPDIFFPEKGGRTTKAANICRTQCPQQTRQACLQYALDHSEKHGVWGGYNERERRLIKAGLPADGTITLPVEKKRRPRITDATPHGIKRYRKGCRCDTCKSGNAEAQRNWKANRRAELKKAS